MTAKRFFVVATLLVALPAVVCAQSDYPQERSKGTGSAWNATTSTTSRSCSTTTTTWRRSTPRSTVCRRPISTTSRSLTINERLRFRQDQANRCQRATSDRADGDIGPGAVPAPPARGLRPHVRGDRRTPRLLEHPRRRPASTPDEIETLDNGWSSDLNLTPADSVRPR